MKNILFMENGEVTLLTNVDDGTNRLVIDGNEIPYSYWVGTGTYIYNGITITKTSSDSLSRNLALKEVGENQYAFTTSAPSKGLTFDDVYPVGSIYMSVNQVNPATLFGGTWEQIKDKFLLSAGDTYANASTGGSADAVVVNHDHTVSVSGGNHRHYTEKYVLYGQSSGNFFGVTMGPSGAASYHPPGQSYTNYSGNLSLSGTAAAKGESGTGKNMPPYLTVNVWKRIA